MSALSTAHVYPAGHGQWAFVAGARSGTGYPSKAAARDAAASALKAQSKAPPVDVLEVMRNASVYLESSGWTPSPSMQKEFSKARAAVAELIEAAQAVENSCVRHDANDADLFQRLDAAIARVKGGAA